MNKEKKTKKIIIIIWKWRDKPQNVKDSWKFIDNDDNFDKVNIIDSKGQIVEDKIIYRIKDKLQYEIIRDIILRKINNDKFTKLVLYHEGNKTGYTTDNFKCLKIKKFKFCGGADEKISSENFIYYYDDQGLLTDTGLFHKNVIMNNEGVKQEYFDEVWDYYFGEIGDDKESPAEKEKQKRNLKQKKNKLLKLWLPLAIDIQGLSEVNDKTGYLNEVEEAWKEDDIEKLFDDHNDIIDSIEDKNINKFKIDENNGNYQNIYQLKNIKGNIDKLINSDEDYFLPNFLHKLIETTDKIIEKQNN